MIILSAIFFIIVSLFTQTAVTPTPISNNVQNSYYSYTITTGSSSPKETVKEKTIINSYEELEKYCNDYYYDENQKLDELLRKYNADYFKTKSLAIEFVPLSNPSERITSISATKDNSNVKISYEIKSPSGDSNVLTVMSYSIIVVEIPKDITGIS